MNFFIPARTGNGWGRRDARGLHVCKCRTAARATGIVTERLAGKERERLDSLMMIMMMSMTARRRSSESGKKNMGCAQGVVLKKDSLLILSSATFEEIRMRTGCKTPDQVSRVSSPSASLPAFLSHLPCGDTGTVQVRRLHKDAVCEKR